MGKHTDRDEVTYSGDWMNNMRHGQGEITYANGKLFIGGFNDDQKYGKGREVDPFGNINRGGVYVDNLLCTDCLENGEILQARP